MNRENKFVFAGAPYSNSAPLVDKLTEVDPRVQVINDHPAKLVADLNAGIADVALIPVAHLFSHPELVMIDGLGVAADGPVKSVLLKCNLPVEQIKTVARDPASATSNALVKVLFPDVEMVDGEGADAWVEIGDRALCSPRASTDDIDLAEAWKAMTGLPFVFAVWAVRKDFSARETITEIAHKACDLGLRDLDKIALRYTNEFGRSQAFWFDYLNRTIHYKLDERDMEGLAEFQARIVSASSR